jgi:hypothetical protein
MKPSFSLTGRGKETCLDIEAASNQLQLELSLEINRRPPALFVLRWALS